MNAGKHFLVGGIILLALLAPPMGASAQSWSWSFETIDPVGKFASAATDDKGNLHVSYISAQEGGELRYALRPAGSSRWFNMTLDKHIPEVFTRIAVDSKGNPHICYTPAVMKYAHWDGKRWYIQEIAPGSGLISHTCSVSVAPDGTPSVTWFQTEHILRYAVLKDGAWMARTLDAEGLVGKWNSMVLDTHGDPLIAYSAWVNGELRVAHWNGKQFEFNTVDSRTRSHGEYNIGEGNSLILDSHGKAHISFYSEKTMKYARQVDGDDWKVEVIDQTTWLGSWMHFRSSIALDSHGFPHICYEDAGVLKHANWDGKQWHIQVLARTGLDSYRYHTMAIDRDDTIYIAFRDPDDSTLKLATGHPSSDRTDPQAKKEEKK